MNAGPAVAALATALSLAVPLIVPLAGKPGKEGPYLVVVPPWADAEALVAKAGGRLSGPRQPLFGHLANGPDGAFAGRLRAAGAWLVVGDSRLLAICGAKP